MRNILLGDWPVDMRVTEGPALRRGGRVVDAGREAPLLGLTIQNKFNHTRQQPL